MRIKEDYLKLQWKFEEGELFLQKLENEISQYSKARDLLCAIEKQLDNLDDVSFYTSKPVHDSIPFDIHKIVFSDPKVYFTYDPQIRFKIYPLYKINVYNLSN